MATSSSLAHGRYSTSPDLSDPPSVLSASSSPQAGTKLKPGRQVDEIVVVHNNPENIRYGPDGLPMLTKNGVPRRKPGPKPGTTIKRQSNQHEEGADKLKKPRKPKDPSAPPVQRKRKNASADPDGSDTRSRAASLGPGMGGAASQQVHRFAEGSRDNTLGRLEHNTQQLPKRDSLPGSMSKILNAESEPTPRPSQSSASTPRISGTAYDPIRSSNYDPIRETMVPNNFSSSMGSPRAPVTATASRASASHSIASLLDYQGVNYGSPGGLPLSSFFEPRKTSTSASVPVSPDPVRKEFTAVTSQPKPISELTKPATVASAKIEIRPQSITTIGAAAAKRASSKEYSTASSPKEGPERSILDFGKAEPGSELIAPSIVLNIPLSVGENNKYVNFMRMAEEQYGWDALHPRQAEARARKARIAAAAAALAQNDSSREGDEMSVDESDNDDSNIEMGGTSGLDKPDGKPIKKKKRHFKEDEYDREDDFVDDSEMLWEEQAAASRDGFFVYSGPLVPEPAKEPSKRDGLPKRGRGSRGGRGGTRGAATGTGRGRGGGPGSRGGVVRKPRMTKADKAQLEKEKVDREANLSKTPTGAGSQNILNPGSPQFAGL
ncbi:HPC2 and ubinuclein domain-containing protein [Microdochium nivale]|nr:HPC2 and ubinuclein domain-containing protein [Microdochium nivale]